MKKTIWIILCIVAIGAGIAYFLIQNKEKTTHIKGYNVLLITLDTTRADALGIYGSKQAHTPNLDRLGREGVVFEQGYSPVPLTLPAHASILTGLYPTAHGVRDNGVYSLGATHNLLSQILKKEGYQTYAAISSFVLLEKFGLAQGFDIYDDQMESQTYILTQESEIPADRVYEKFRGWWSRQQKNPQPFFAWIHFYDPHAPYIYHQDLGKSFSSDGRGRYASEVAFTDQYVGRIIDDLKKAGRLERTLVVVVGDHGEGFGEHNESGHGIFCYEESLKVPFILTNPAALPKGLKISQRVSLVDLYPTLTAMLQVDAPAESHGINLMPLINNPETPVERVLYFESMHGKEESGWAPLMGIIKDNYKYISLPDSELYQLEKDPLEKDNMFWKKNPFAKNLDKELKAILLQHTTQQTSQKRNLSTQDSKHLQSLGYISSFSDKNQAGLDPKRGIQIRKSLSAVSKLIDQNQIPEAETRLTEMAEDKHVKIPKYYFLLQKIYQRKGDTLNRIRCLEEAAAKFPAMEEINRMLVETLMAENRIQDARKWSMAFLKSDPRNTATYTRLAQIAQQEGKFKESLELLEKGLQFEPRNASLWATLGFRSLILAKQHKDKHMLGKSLTSLTRALELEENLPHAWNKRGEAHMLANRIPEAVKDWKKTLKMKPDLAETYISLGLIYIYKLKDKPTGLQYLTTCRTQYFHLLSPPKQQYLTKILSLANQR